MCREDVSVVVRRVKHGGWFLLIAQHRHQEAAPMLAPAVDEPLLDFTSFLNNFCRATCHTTHHYRPRSINTLRILQSLECLQASNAVVEQIELRPMTTRHTRTRLSAMA